MRLAAAAGAKVAQTRSLSASWLYAGTWFGEALEMLGEDLVLLPRELLLLEGARVEVISSNSEPETIGALELDVSGQISV